MAVGDAHVFPGFLTPVLTQLFFQKPPTTFLTCFCRGERRKYTGRKVRFNRGSNSQPPGHESDTLTTEPPGRVVSCLYSNNSTGGYHEKTEMLLGLGQYSPAILRSIPSLTFYHTIPTSNNPEEEAFAQHCGKRRKCW